MTGRIPFGLLSLLTVLVCAPIQAQDQMGPPPGYGVQPPAFGVPPLSYGAQPAGFHSSDGGPGQYHPLPLTYQRDQGTSRPWNRSSQTTYEQLPDDLGFGDEDTQLGKLLTQTFSHAWFRSEYLQWSISKPGSGILLRTTNI